MAEAVRTYFGKPENKKDPNAVLMKPPKKNKGQPPKPDLPTTIPRGKNVPTPAETKEKRDKHVDKPTATEQSAFQHNQVVQEVNINVTFTPSSSTFISLVEMTFRELTIDNPNLSKQWTYEMFLYYCTSLYWLRVVSLKSKFNQDMTFEESLLQQKYEGQTFNVPEPIRLYLTGLGKTKTVAGQTLYLTFPPLPTEVLATIPATFGVITDDNHNLYEEIPTLAVPILQLLGSLTEVNPFPQPLYPMVPQGSRPSMNLLGYHRLSKPRSEALAQLEGAGITADHFPNSPQNTGFNITLLKVVSNILATLGTFKLTSVDFFASSEAGSVAQTIIVRPLLTNGNEVRCIDAESTPTCLNSEPTSAFGIATAFGYQTMKEPFENDNLNWYCLIPAANAQPPRAAVQNRNDRRNLPLQYDVIVFRSLTQSTYDFRLSVIQSLILTKR